MLNNPESAFDIDFGFKVCHKGKAMLIQLTINLIQNMLAIDLNESITNLLLSMAFIRNAIISVYKLYENCR